MESGESDCFICNTGKLILSSSSFEVPHFGEVCISTYVCNSCGYRSTDVIPLRSRPPCRYKCTINGDSSLSIRVIRSHTGIVRIPELGIRIDPGVAANGFITNVEGILNRVEGIIDHVLRDSYKAIEVGEMAEENMARISRCRSLKDIIASCRCGGNPLTLVIEDPSGNSAIYGDDPSISIEELTESDIISLGP
jgi:zinc finger protein